MLGCHSNEVRCLNPSGKTNHLFDYCCDGFAMVTQTLLTGNHAINNLI